MDAETLRRWAALPFRELAVEVMLPYVGEDLSREELSGLVERSYATFSHPEVRRQWWSPAGAPWRSWMPSLGLPDR